MIYLGQIAGALELQKWCAARGHSRISPVRIDQLRRQIRERRQYVYAKSLEAQERQTWERKQQLKDALATGKRLPTELRKDAESLGRDMEFDEAQAGE